MARVGINTGNRVNVGGQYGVARQAQAYGSTEGQIGAETGETFWSAARLIVEQCYELLAPGSYSAWVTKRFVRNGEIVDFSEQWRKLCESCGFEFVEAKRAWLVKQKGRQIDLEGEVVELQVERKSFFRRLAERNGSPRIDWEDVIFMRKPAAGTKAGIGVRRSLVSSPPYAAEEKHERPTGTQGNKGQGLLEDFMAIPPAN